MDDRKLASSKLDQKIEEQTPILLVRKTHKSTKNQDPEEMDRIQLGKDKFIDLEVTDRDYDKRNWILKVFDCFLGRKKYFARTVYINGTTYPSYQSYPANVVRNQKYSLLTFLPVALYEQFKFFFNFYYLIITLTQFIPILQVGFLFTYVAPLAFVMGITLLKELFDDLKRMKRDYEANSQKYEKLTPTGTEIIPSSSIKVGDMIFIHPNQRIPADCILLRTSEKTGASFIRTDQLDGETDWKLRRPIPSLQKLKSNEQLFEVNGYIYAEKPKKEIYDFLGTFTTINPTDGSEEVDSLNLENTLWTNTVVATGTVIGLVLYTGKETRASLNTSNPTSKIGLLDLELNFFSKLLFVLMLILSFLMIALNLFRGLWFITFFRFLLLFSSIIPISMRVNLDMGKTLYSFFIMRDKKIQDTIVRNSSIPEELGRISYLFSDKTGTLTQNDMIFKKLHLGSISFTQDDLSDIASQLKDGYSKESKVHKMMNAVGLCHNVTPTTEGEERVLQASSPDEIALVKFAESVGLILHDRTLTTITIQTPINTIENYEVLQIFPFTSESKRMGIVVENKETGQIYFYVKGADVIMSKIVDSADWLTEECDNLARSGLRTLVFGQKLLKRSEYDEFAENYKIAKATMQNRTENMNKVREELEIGLELVGVTGVEDKLQENVQECIENLRNADIKIWMLTGDKVETATCIARSTKLVSRAQNIFYILSKSPEEISDKLDEFNTQTDSCLILDGSTLQVCVDHLKEKFCSIAKKAPCVVCCRCSPTQKAVIVEMIKDSDKSKRVAAIGDGGNDVSMILAAHCGIGIVGKEGKHASLAADFSINQFSHCQRLILWHGRNSYKRSARLSQFVIHRGLIISIIQALFSAIFYFAAIPIYTGWLMVGYATFYTMVPVFAIVLDSDVSEDVAFRFPELYKELQKGRSLNVKTFFSFVFKAVYQGGIIMLLSILLFDSSFQRIVSITFTALIITELLMVQIEVHRHCNPWIIIANFVSLILYFLSILLLPSYFDIPFVMSIHFWWRVLIIIIVSLAPVYIVKFLSQKINPPSYTKL